MCVPCSTPGLPWHSVAECSPSAEPRPPASTPIERDGAIGEEAMEQADRVATAADARERRIRQAALLEQLRARLAADHGLQLAHENRIRVRADRRSRAGNRCRPGPIPSRESRRRSPRAACGRRISRRRPSRRSGASDRRSAPGARRRSRPCTPCTAGRRARTPPPTRRRADPRRSRRRRASRRAPSRAAPGRCRC